MVVLVAQQEVLDNADVCTFSSYLCQNESVLVSFNISRNMSTSVLVNVPIGFCLVISHIVKEKAVAETKSSCFSSTGFTSWLCHLIGMSKRHDL